MNKSPIEIIQSISFKQQLEDNVMKAVRKVGIQVNKEELQRLIDKATPVKPEYETDRYANGVLVYDTWLCPNCKTRYEVDYDEFEYCPKCGQCIDWSEDNE